MVPPAVPPANVSASPFGVSAPRFRRSWWRRDGPSGYPVLNEEYATTIARDWNVKASGVGYVTRFEVVAEYR